MDDGYEGSSGETSENSTETGSVDIGEVSAVTETETAAAFDETSEDSGEIDPDVSVEVEKDSGKGESLETPVGLSEEEISAAFDEEPLAEMDAPVSPETKAEQSVNEVEAKSTEGSENTETAEIIHVNCTREDLAGQEHPETGIPYETKVVEVNGKQLEVTVPKFESNFDTKLESDQLQLDRSKHNDICNIKLKEQCEENPEWARETFSQKQLDQIKSGKNPEGYTWHHDGGEVGHMQLVDSKIHFDTRHTGGIAIWGNKSKYT